MDRPKRAQKLATDIMMRYKKTVITVDLLVDIITDYGFEIVDYGAKDDYIGPEQLIEDLNLSCFADVENTFICKSGDSKYLFVSENLTLPEKTYSLAHELGHIVCGHLSNESSAKVDIYEEYEANEFAHFILHPGLLSKTLVWVKSHTLLSACFAVLIICGIIAIPIAKNAALEKSYYGEYYITSSGGKYHNKDCKYIKGRNNISRLTVVDFDSGKYEACRVCIDGN